MKKRKKKSDFTLCLSGDFLGKTRLVVRFVFKTTSPLGSEHLRGEIERQQTLENFVNIFIRSVLGQGI